MIQQAKIPSPKAVLMDFLYVSVQVPDRYVFTNKKECVMFVGGKIIDI